MNFTAFRLDPPQRAGQKKGCQFPTPEEPVLWDQEGVTKGGRQVVSSPFGDHSRAEVWFSSPKASSFLSVPFSFPARCCREAGRDTNLKASLEIQVRA